MLLMFVKIVKMLAALVKQFTKNVQLMLLMFVKTVQMLAALQQYPT